MPVAGPVLVGAVDAWHWLRSRPGAADAVAPVDPAAQQLVDLYRPVAGATGRFVVAQLGQSLDGRIATRTGDARYVTGPADREHLHRLRALVDAVVVGVGTVAADDPQLTVRACPGKDPHRVVLDPRARAPRSSRVLLDGTPTTWVLAPGADVTGVGGHVRVRRLPCSPDGFVPAAVLDLLDDLGLRRVLVEGGGRTVSHFLRAGALDRLHLSVAPVLLGSDGAAGLRVPGPALARDALRPPSRSFRLGDDVCFDLDLTAQPVVGPATRTSAARPPRQQERHEAG